MNVSVPVTIFPIPVKEEYDGGVYLVKETAAEENLVAFYEKVKDGNRDIPCGRSTGPGPP